MRITAPICRVEEVAALAAAGADELYCGVVPPEWVARFGTGAVNRRLFGNFADWEDVAAAANAARAAAVRLLLVLNAQHYATGQVPALVEIARRFVGLGGGGLIVADLGLLAALAAADLGVPLHASSVATCRNAEAAGFVRELGARRVILPRDVTLAEACRLARAWPDLEVEAFVLGDGCAFEEGLCQTLHLPPRLGGPICLDGWQHEWERRDGAPLTGEQRALLAANDAAYGRWLWYRFGCGFAATPAGLPYGPCGLCAVPALLRAGVAAIKVAGREAPAARKVHGVRLVHEARARCAAGAGDADLLAWARGVRGEPGRCDSGAMCYYPEVLRGPRPDPTG